MVTMLLGGLWHGGAWTFVLWGGYHGALLVAQQGLALLVKRWPTARTTLEGSLGPSLRRGFTFALVLVGWVIFRAESFEDLWTYLAAMVGLGAQDGVYSLFFPVVASVGIVAWQHRPESWDERLRSERWPQFLRCIVLALLVLVCLVLGSAQANQFIYFQF